MKTALFLITGFEEIEALTTVDVLRRGQADVKMISLTDENWVTGSHGITVQTDLTLSEAMESDFKMLILPGGPGAAHYQTHKAFADYLIQQSQAEKIIAAICAAPTFLGKLGLLKGKRAVCYPGMEKDLAGAELSTEMVVTDGNIVTAKGPAATLYFGLKLLEIAAGKDTADNVRKGMLAECK
ncbi:MAG: DJ-1/PfpI family protein [Clostridiales bacterium]|jgi:4-methyl-5(b-hydroxyethyl)-thiazole monophosphate biosynthesis|nr:DJ-1/PfpI family protein [Clostridiales bacterium]